MDLVFFFSRFKPSILDMLEVGLYNFFLYFYMNLS